MNWNLLWVQVWFFVWESVWLQFTGYQLPLTLPIFKGIQVFNCQLNSTWIDGSNWSFFTEKTKTVHVYIHRQINVHVTRWCIWLIQFCLCELFLLGCKWIHFISHPPTTEIRNTMKKTCEKWYTKKWAW